VSECKKAVARTIKDYVARGGFLFAMCSATDTYDIALSAEGVDVVDSPYDGDPPDPNAQRKLDFTRTLAFRNFSLLIDPYVYEYSDLDATMEAVARGRSSFFTLFDFRRRRSGPDHAHPGPHERGAGVPRTDDRVPQGIPEAGVTVLGEVDGTDEAKYIHGDYGRARSPSTGATTRRTTSTRWGIRRPTFRSTSTRRGTG
jgi:hypothetical protein